jgi:hypothetical protein
VVGGGIPGGGTFFPIIGMDQHFPTHETGHHTSKEYVRDDVHTNSAEGYFSIFKRGMRGIYQHCSEKNLHRIWRSLTSATINRVKLGYDDGERAALASRAQKPNSVVVSTA